MNIKPLGDRVIVQVLEAEERTASGIVLPDTAQEKPQQGKVVAVGPGRYTEDGKTVPMSVKEGDTVLFAKFGGTEVKYKGEEYLVMKETDILAVLA